MARKRKRAPHGDGQAIKKMGIRLAIFGLLSVLFAQLYPMLASDYGPASNRLANLRGVCPPNCTMTPLGCSPRAESRWRR